MDCLLQIKVKVNFWWVEGQSVSKVMSCSVAVSEMTLFSSLSLWQAVIDLLFMPHELISISKDGTVAFWELSSGECTRSLDVSCLNPGPNTRMHLSSDGRRLVVDSDAINSPVYIFDMKTGQLLHKYVLSL